jgi:hypothetical protein
MPGGHFPIAVRKVDEDGQTPKEVRGVTRDPEIIKDMIRRAAEEGETDYFHVDFPSLAAA